MKEAMAVTGYVDQSVAAALSKGSVKTSVDVRPERDIKEVVARVLASDIASVRTGATKNGQVLVQLILREGARVETVVAVAASPNGMRAFHDPVLNRVRQEATAKKIMV